MACGVQSREVAGGMKTAVRLEEEGSAAPFVCVPASSEARERGTSSCGELAGLWTGFLDTASCKLWV